MTRTSLNLLVLLALAFVAASTAKDKFKPWTQWNIKEAEKILNDSAWVQTQDGGNTSREELQALQTNLHGDGLSMGRASMIELRFRIRLISALPVRQAFARMALLSRKTVDPELEQKMQRFVETRSEQSIVVAVATESVRYTSDEQDAIFNSAHLSSLRTTAWLKTDDGTQNYLVDYAPPGPDGLGAKFVFPRQVDGHSFITPDSRYLHFHSVLSALNSSGDAAITLHARFKIADLMYNHVLEY